MGYGGKQYTMRTVSKIDIYEMMNNILCHFTIGNVLYNEKHFRTSSGAATTITRILFKA